MKYFRNAVNSKFGRYVFGLGCGVFLLNACDSSDSPLKLYKDGMKLHLNGDETVDIVYAEHATFGSELMMKTQNLDGSFSEPKRISRFNGGIIRIEPSGEGNAPDLKIKIHLARGLCKDYVLKNDGNGNFTRSEK